jgi:hypothetical protein
MSDPERNDWSWQIDATRIGRGNMVDHDVVMVPVKHIDAWIAA